jgi:GNAT superfamily N-acetyltransferase
MAEIVSVVAGSAEVDALKELLLGYRDFLASVASMHCFDFAAYREEVANAPLPYTSAEGEVLLALIDSNVAGCIAFRAVRGEAATCEVKRLFVVEAFRGRAIARLLVEEALKRARARGFSRAILDTDLVAMPAAFALYKSFGFTEYSPLFEPFSPTLRFFEMLLK